MLFLGPKSLLLETRTLASALSSSTGTRRVAMDRCIRSLKSAGVWTKLDVMLDFSTAAGADMGTDWKTPGRTKPVFMGSPTTGTGTSSNKRLNAHFKGNTVDIYAKTGVIPSGISGVDQNNFMEFMWANYGIPGSSNGSTGVRNPSTTRCTIDPGPTAITAWCNDPTANNLSVNPEAIVYSKYGLIAIEHSAAAVRNSYARGIVIDSNNAAATANSPCTAEAYVGGVNNQGVLLSPHDFPTSFFGYGKSLTAGQHLAFHNALFRYMQDIGNWKRPAVWWGDSIFTHPILTSNPYPAAIAARNADPWREWSNQGVPGESTSQILARMQADTTYWDYHQVIGGGINDLRAAFANQAAADAAITLALTNYGAMRDLAVSRSGGHYSFFLPFLGDSNDTVNGGPGNTGMYTAGINNYAVNTFIASAKSTFGTGRCYDAQAGLIAAATGAAQDITDLANGITPRSQREDYLHENNLGASVLGIGWAAVATALSE